MLQVKKIDLTNNGTVTLKGEGSTGIFASNVENPVGSGIYTGALTDSSIKNTGTITLDAKKNSRYLYTKIKYI